MIVPALTLSAILAIAACEAPEDAPGEAPPLTAEAGQAESTRTHFDQAAGLAGRAPFTLPSMQSAFPGHEIISRSKDAAAGTPPAFEVRAAGSDKALFLVTPDWSRGQVGEVSTTSAAVEGPNGMRVGASRQSEAVAAFSEACAAQTCEATIAGERLSLEFSGEGEDPLLTRLVWLPNPP